MKIETNKQWTTYRILDATIDNPDLADPFTVGAVGAGKDFIVHATASSGKLHWDEDANIFYIIATTMMGYGSQFQFTPGGVGAGTGISFYSTGMYIRCSAANVLDFGTTPAGYLHMVNRVILDSTIQLTYDVTPSREGELALASDNRLQYAVGDGSIIYKVPFYLSPGPSDVVLPSGIGLQMGDKLRLQVSTVAPSIAGDLCLHTNDNLLTYYTNVGTVWKAAAIDDAGFLRLPELTTTATVRGQMYLDSDNRIMYSPGSSLEYKLVAYNATAGSAFAIPAGIKLNCGSYFTLFKTTGNSSTQGEVWFHTPSKTLRFHDGVTIKTCLTA